jgi:hypothetical protein
MQVKFSKALVASGLLMAAAQASAVTLTFETLAVGAVLSNQYAAQGAVFSANAFSGANSNSTPDDWATNTDMTIVSSLAGGDVGGLGTPALVSGNVLHSFNNWLGEDGDPSFKITFSTPINSFSATFAGVSTAADVMLFAYNGATLLGTVTATTTGQFVLSFAAPSITSVAIAPGSFDDWVGVDNITFTQVVPEPSTYGLMALGLGLIALRRRVR